MKSLKKYRDATGKLQFFVKETDNKSLVCSANGGKAIGFCDQHYSYDVIGRKLALGSDAGLIYMKEIEKKQKN